jgi:PEGA domain
MCGTCKLLSPALAAVLVVSQMGTVVAQTQAIIGAPSPIASDRVVVKDGTDVKLKFIQALSSKTAHVGDPVTLELAEDLRVNDVVAVREGAKATGEITVAKKAGMLGKGGDLALQLYYLKAGDNKIKLRGTKGQEGDSKVGTAIVLTVLVGVFGLIKHGKQAEIPAGSVITAYTTDDTGLPIGASPASPEQSVGQVSLTSEPAGGEIQIDGKFFGNTPAVLALAPGEHKVLVTSAGKRWERTLTVSVGSKLVVNAILEQAPAQ